LRLLNETRRTGEHKTVQARILVYAEAIGWTVVCHEEAEQRREFDSTVPAADRAVNRSLFFDDLLDTKVREFNPRYAEAEGAIWNMSPALHGSTGFFATTTGASSSR
jgi:type I restriction enzyme R subunit